MNTKDLLNRTSSNLGVLPLVGMAGAEAAGIPALDVMTPGLSTSMHMGILGGGNFLWHNKGLRFSGPWGYKTLFAGVNSSKSHLTFGNAVLSAIEHAGKKAFEGGYQTKVTAWASNARELGLASLFHGEETIKPKYENALSSRFAAERGTTSQKKKMVEKVSKSRWTQALTGSNADDVGIKRIAGKVDNFLFPKISGSGTAAFFGRRGAALGTMLSWYSAYEIAKIPVEWMVQNAYDTTVKHVGQLQNFLVNEQQFRMGSGYLSSSFQNQYAATERQRAIQAIYASRVNPSNRVYGSEAKLAHR